MKNLMLDADKLDECDLFKPLTHMFDMPLDKNNNQAIYLNGNSLGPKPKAIDDELKHECEKWGSLGVRGHFAKECHWISYVERAANSLARLVGAKPEEVVACATLTANLHSVFISFYRPTQDRFKIIRLFGFPSDTYAIASQVEQRLQTIRDFTGNDSIKSNEVIIQINPDKNGYIDLNTFKKVFAEHGHSTSIIWIEAIHYLTGQYFDIPELVQLAHQYGCKIGFDLAHAIGNVPLSLHDWGVDFAVWCNYKYVSAGPGSIGGLYIHEKYVRDHDMVRFAGWWGHNKLTRFQMPGVFDPIPTAEGWLVSTSSAFLLASLFKALDIFDQVDLHELREKNKRLVVYLENLLRDELPDNVEIITPKNPDERGCQLSLRIKCSADGDVIEEKLLDLGVICDVRSDLIRVAPMGLYTTYLDVFSFVEKLAIICNSMKSETVLKKSQIELISSSQYYP